jgi:indoleamine 2,3-dioxygenase
MSLLVAMVQHTPALVQAALHTLDATNWRRSELFRTSLSDVLRVMQLINSEMDGMWKNSAPRSVPGRLSAHMDLPEQMTSAYNSYRTFIMGTKNQPMFPNGVVYEGVDDKVWI